MPLRACHSCRPRKRCCWGLLQLALEAMCLWWPCLGSPPGSGLTCCSPRHGPQRQPPGQLAAAPRPGKPHGQAPHVPGRLVCQHPRSRELAKKSGVARGPDAVPQPRGRFAVPELPLEARSRSRSRCSTPLGSKAHSNREAPAKVPKAGLPCPLLCKVTARTRSRLSRGAPWWVAVARGRWGKAGGQLSGLRAPGGPNPKGAPLPGSGSGSPPLTRQALRILDMGAGKRHWRK
jgi:hypothetical protein